MPALKITETQAEVIQRMRAAGFPLVRWDGGYWTLKGSPVHHSSPGTGDVPPWYVMVQTVYAMERKGLLERLHTYPEMWRDDRRLTSLAQTVAL